jgi:hypothetical protein
MDTERGIRVTSETSNPDGEVLGLPVYVTAVTWIVLIVDQVE